MVSLPVLRGCITSGEQWVFFIYEVKEVLRYTIIARYYTFIISFLCHTHLPLGRNMPRYIFGNLQNRAVSSSY
jgi:hypothetical protein